MAYPQALVPSGRLVVRVEPEVQVLSGGLRPFMFHSAAGTLVLQAALRYPTGWVLPSKNRRVGLPGTVVSRDDGQTWQVWGPEEGQGQGPIIQVRQHPHELRAENEPHALGAPAFRGSGADLALRFDHRRPVG